MSKTKEMPDAEVARKVEKLRKTGRILTEPQILPTKTLPEMPIFLRLYMDSPLINARIEETDGELVFWQQYREANDATWDLLKERFFADVSKMRDEFFAVSTPQAALTFLDTWPHFYVQPEDLVKPRREHVSWEDFQAWQLFFREEIKGVTWEQNEPRRQEFFTKMVVNPNRHLSDRELQTILNRAPDVRLETTQHAAKPVLQVWIRCESVTEAIAASIFVDDLAQVQHQVCRNCGKIFDRYEKSQHARIFCKPACAKAFHKRKGKLAKVG